MLRLLIGIGLAIFGLLLFQRVWLAMIINMVNNSPSVGMPVSTVPAGNFSLPTEDAPAYIGEERAINDMAISVTRVVRPADSPRGKSLFTSLDAGQEYMLVGIRVRCTAADKSCRAVELDFGVSGNSRKDYTPEFSTGFDNLDGLFQGGDIAPGESMSGDLVFIVSQDDSGLKMFYPRTYGFAHTVSFWLGQ